MTTNTKTPLQAVVSVICDCLCELSPEDQARTLEAVRVTLGLRASTNISTSTKDRNPFQELRPQQPTVEVEMVNGHPVVVNQQTDTPPTETPRLRHVVAGPRRVTVLGLSWSDNRGVQGSEARSPGYVRAPR
jgi:hypothetical protein